MPHRREPAVRVRGLEKRYDGVVALCGVDFEVRTGEWIGLLGPNGAGKTTVLHTLAGLLGPDVGTVEILGGSPTGAGSRKIRASIGLVPQTIALYPMLTARENLAVFARLHGVARVDVPPRVDWALEWCGLAERAGQRVGTYSCGMQRRLNIACGVMHRPRLVLLDEPTVGVDPQARHRIHAMLEELRGEGASIIQSTHALNEVEQFGDRMLIIDRGRIIADGTVPELVAGSLGDSSTFRLVLDRPPRDLELDRKVQVQGAEISGTTTDASQDLPSMLASMKARGYRVERLHVDSPGLEEVFASLTGRELRE